MRNKLALVLAVFALAFMAAPAAFAYDQNDHVYVAPNGVGDALVFPVYLASGTFKTNIRVINTSCEFAVVAKVVFREGISSCETRDFLIYLTPNDMWWADIVDDNGTVTIVSDDDSSPVVPLEVPLAASCNGYPDLIGYVEVYVAYAFADFDDTSCAGDIANHCWSTPIPKEDLKLAYEAAASSYPLDLCDEAADCLLWDEEVLYDHAEVWLSQPVLAGVEELTDPSAGLVMPMVATALANNCNDIKLNVQSETRWDNYGNNTAHEVRAALSKENFHIPFRSDSANATFALLNFPAKLSCCTSGSQDCDGSVSDCVSGVGDECINCDSLITNDGDCEHREEYQTTWNNSTYDLEENTPRQDDPIFSPVPPEASKPPFREEVVLFDLDNYSGFDLTSTYEEGWIRFTLTDACWQRHGLTLRGVETLNDQAVWYLGSAVIPTYLQLGADLTWVPATWDCANVIVTDASYDTDICPGGICPMPPPFDCMSDFENCSYQSTSKNLTPWAGCVCVE